MTFCEAANAQMSDCMMESQVYDTTQLELIKQTVSTLAAVALKQLCIKIGLNLKELSHGFVDYQPLLNK